MVLAGGRAATHFLSVFLGDSGAGQSGFRVGYGRPSRQRDEPFTHTSLQSQVDTSWSRFF